MPGRVKVTNWKPGRPISSVRRHWHGKHDLETGGDLVHRSYDGTNTSHPVQLLRADNSLAEEINFGPAGTINPADTELAAFLQDHWALNDYLAFDLRSARCPGRPWE